MNKEEIAKFCFLIFVMLLIKILTKKVNKMLTKQTVIRYIKELSLSLTEITIFVKFVKFHDV